MIYSISGITAVYFAVQRPDKRYGAVWKINKSLTLSTRRRRYTPGNFQRAYRPETISITNAR